MALKDACRELGVIEGRVFMGESSITDDENTQSSLTNASRDVFPLLPGGRRGELWHHRCLPSGDRSSGL